MMRLLYRISFKFWSFLISSWLKERQLNPNMKLKYGLLTESTSYYLILLHEILLLLFSLISIAITSLQQGLKDWRIHIFYNYVMCSVHAAAAVGVGIVSWVDYIILYLIVQTQLSSLFYMLACLHMAAGLPSLLLMILKVINYAFRIFIITYSSPHCTYQLCMLVRTLRRAVLETICS